MIKVVDLSEICISKHIINKVIFYNQTINICQFKLSALPDGFPLNRMESIMELSHEAFLKLLECEPIELDLISNNKYEIRNGRHRVARVVNC